MYIGARAGSVHSTSRGGVREPGEPVDPGGGDRPAHRRCGRAERSGCISRRQGKFNGDFCKVTGIVKPNNPTSPSLEFEVNLPAAWNRRVLQMGGGGYNGTLVTGLGGFTLQPANVDNPLKQGFVTVGTDGGHKSAAGFDGSFAYGR